MDKIEQYFPHIEKLFPLIDFCRNTVDFFEGIIQELCKLKDVRLRGDFYSSGFNQKFRDGYAASLLEEDKNGKGYYRISVNNVLLEQKAHEWRSDSGGIYTVE